MKYLRLLPLLLFSTFYILNSSFALAQVSPSSVTTPSSLAKGVPPLGSYDGEAFDTVNLYNGNLSMRFPLGALSGRGGMTAAVVLSYNAKLWRAEQKPAAKPGRSTSGDRTGSSLNSSVSRLGHRGADDRSGLAAPRRTAVGPAIRVE